MRTLRFLPAVALVALAVPPAAQAGHGHDPGDHNYGHGRNLVKVIATGLDSPRHLAFGDRGELFVAEAGRGGTALCFTGGEGPACMGATGAVTKIDRWGRQYRIVSGLPSMANTPGDVNAIGPHGVTVTRDGRVLITNGGPTEPKDAAGHTIFRETLADTLPAASWFGKVLRIGRHGRVVALADIWDYERDFNPDKTVGNPAVDSNAVDILQDGDRLVVADAGGNALDTVDAFGRVKNLALFPNRAVDTPFPGFPMQAVPTSVVKGPDGQYYVSQLTGFPFPPGGANIYRVNPATGAVSTFATGFTNLMDLAFDRRGTLYALSIDDNGLTTPGDEGALYRVSRSGAKERVQLPAGTLPFPGGIAVGDDGLYATINSGSPGGGKVIRLRLW
jgi:sugar lactone lactonase YvrE